jgi:hypothetical protein
MERIATGLACALELNLQQASAKTAGKASIANETSYSRPLIQQS